MNEGKFTPEEFEKRISRIIDSAAAECLDFAEEFDPVLATFTEKLQDFSSNRLGGGREAQEFVDRMILPLTLAVKGGMGVGVKLSMCAILSFSEGVRKYVESGNREDILDSVRDLVEFMESVEQGISQKALHLMGEMDKDTLPDDLKKYLEDGE